MGLSTDKTTSSLTIKKFLQFCLKHSLLMNFKCNPISLFSSNQAVELAQ
jgi:hypothetical protein